MKVLLKKTWISCKIESEAVAELAPNSTYFVNFEPQCASMRAGFASDCKPSSPHAQLTVWNALACVIGSESRHFLTQEKPPTVQSEVHSS